MPTEKTLCTAYSIIFVDSVYRKSKSCYPLVILEDCKYMVKKWNNKKKYSWKMNQEKRYIAENLFDSDSDFNSNSDYKS